MDSDRQGNFHRETLTVAGVGAGEQAYHGVASAIYPSAPYMRDGFGNYPKGHSYSRDQNPTFDDVEAASSIDALDASIIHRRTVGR